VLSLGIAGFLRMPPSLASAFSGDFSGIFPFPFLPGTPGFDTLSEV
jgi:hypothetical protein